MNIPPETRLLIYHNLLVVPNALPLNVGQAMYVSKDGRYHDDTGREHALYVCEPTTEAFNRYTSCMPNYV